MNIPILFFSPNIKLMALLGGGVFGGFVGGAGMGAMINENHPKLKGYFMGVGSVIGIGLGSYICTEWISFYRKFSIWLRK